MEQLQNKDPENDDTPSEVSEAEDIGFLGRYPFQHVYYSTIEVRVPTHSTGIVDHLLFSSPRLSFGDAIIAPLLIC